MADLTSRAVGEGGGAHPIRISRDDEREIVMNDGTRISGRKAGGTYVVDSALAHHYVEVTKVARYADDEKPPAVTDRAMASPPRAPKK